MVAEEFISVQELVEESETSAATVYRVARRLGVAAQRLPGRGRKAFFSKDDAGLIKAHLRRPRPRVRWDDVARFEESFGLSRKTFLSAAELRPAPGGSVATVEVVNWLRYFADRGEQLQSSPEANSIFQLDCRPLSLKAGAESFGPPAGRFLPVNVLAAAELGSIVGLMDEYRKGLLYVCHELPLRRASNIISWGGPLSSAIPRLIYRYKRRGGEQFTLLGDSPIDFTFFGSQMKLSEPDAVFLTAMSSTQWGLSTVR
jgi:hypothetical protein